MTEFLTENARRAYPLEREWPDGMDAWSRVLVDASVSTDVELGDRRLSLTSVTRCGPQLTFTVGIPALGALRVTFDRSLWTGGRTAVVYGSGSARQGALMPYGGLVEYIQTQPLTSAEQYTTHVDTEISPTQNTEVYVDFMILDNVGGDQICAARTGASNANRFFTYASSANGRVVMGTWQVASINLANGTRHTILFNESGTHNWYIDGGLRGNVTSETYVKTNDNTLFLFATSGYAPSYGTSNSRIYACRIKEAGVLVRDFRPVVDWCGRPCFYDAVTGARFYAQGTGGLVAGPAADPAADPALAGIKALLTLNVEAVDALLADLDEEGGDVNVPFAMRCSGDAVRRVTGITAQGAGDCRTPVFSPTDAHKVEKSVGSNEHAVIKADDGVDLEVTGMAPLVGDVLRVSALTAPEAAELDEEPADMMIRGDDCFTVETIPGAKALKDEKGNLVDIVAREEADGDGGVVKIGTACKPCCQCEDYKDAVDMLRPAETKAVALEDELDEIEDAYESALAAFNSGKEAAEAAVNSLDNVRLAISTAGSCAAYAGSNAQGTRQRFTATLIIENLTMVQAVVSNLSITTDAAYADAYTAVKTVESGSRTLQPGATLVMVTTFRTTDESVNSNTLDSPPAVHASCTVTLYKLNSITPVASGTKSI